MGELLEKPGARKKKFIIGAGAALILFMLFFHIVPTHLTVFPKEYPSFANTFISVDDYLNQYNDANFLIKIPMRTSYLFRKLSEKGIIVSESESPNRTTTESPEDQATNNTLSEDTPREAQRVDPAVERRIRAIYAKKYPADFSMQKTLIEDQLESYRSLMNWNKSEGMPQPTFAKLKSIYANKYPNDYTMQKTLIADQCESYISLSSLNYPNVPDEVIDKLKQTYSRKYPFDFSMQKTLIQDQIESYIRLNR